jgi:hypothetical protein
MIKVKLSLYRPLRLPQFSDIRLTDGGKVVKPYAPATFYAQEN